MTGTRVWLLVVLVGLGLIGLTLGWPQRQAASPVLPAVQPPPAPKPPPLPRTWQRQWEGFRTRFVQPDGRVIDHTSDDRSTSEGQAYALVFALLANDRETFTRILTWTRDNLSGGDLAHQPAWLWGKTGGGDWRIIDANPASDASLWLAYALIEGGRLWQEPTYLPWAKALLQDVAKTEVVKAGDGSPLLLPGPEGFGDTTEGWRINQSYLADFQLRRLAEVDPEGPWTRLWQTHVARLSQLPPPGLALDWLHVNPDGSIDTRTLEPASYDAIRVYLWAGLSWRLANSKDQSPLCAYTDLLRRDGGPREHTRPNGTTEGVAPVGFSAALLPFVRRCGATDLLAGLHQRLDQAWNGQVFGEPAQYYDQALALFGTGFDEGRYIINDTGQIEPSWTSAH